MKNHILRKRLILHLLLAFIGIIFLLSFANPCFAQTDKTAETYKTLIQDADKAFAAKDYEGALHTYEKAHEVKPEYNYATDKIDEIKKILDAGSDSKIQSDQSKKSGSTYKTLIAQADYALSAKDYAGALLFYDKAYQTRPDYNYAPEKIDEINSILNASPDSKSQLFENTMQKAESLYAQKNYQKAKPEFQKAALIDTSAQLPKERLTQISSFYVDPDDMTNFNLAIASGDKELAISDFDHAILFYDAALSLHPSSKFVKDKITVTKKQKADYKVQTEQVTAADKPHPSEKPAEAPNSKVIPGLSIAGESQMHADQQKYDAALASAENHLKSADYQAALAGFKSASAIKPAETYPKTKIAEIEMLLTESTSRKAAFDLAIKNGDQSLNEKKYDVALTSYRNALSLFPDEKYPSQKIEEITIIREKQKESDVNYSKSIVEADKQFNENRFEDAILFYTKALGFKPAEAYPQQKITEAQVKLAASKNLDENYASAIAGGDKFLSESKYNEALIAYNQALTIRPNEVYPAGKTAEINSILAKQKSDADNYAQAIRTGEKAMASGNLSLALTAYEEARKIKPTEQYPMEQITEIKAVTAKQQKSDEKYTVAVKTGDQLFVDKEYQGALNAYAEASELKKNEKYPQDQIAKINKILGDSRSAGDNYTLAIAEGDKLFGMKDYTGANSAFAKASEIKPAETYPKQRIIEINKIIEEIALARSSEYNNALEIADKLYNKKVFDQAIEAYEAAVKINPGDAYPELQIGKIRKYMSDHAILNLYSQPLVISRGDEKKFTFTAIEPGLRKNNYILLKVHSIGKTPPKVYLNYGKDDTKNGGIVLRNLDKSSLSDYLISISSQDKWFREENNWISISVETGDIEITEVQIAAGE